MHAPRCPLKQVNPVTASVRLRNSQSLSACDSLVSVSTVCGYTVTPRSGNHVSPRSWLLSKERHFLLVQRLSDPAAYLYLQFEQPLSLCGAGLESVLPPPCLARAPWTAPRTGAPARSCAVQLLLGWAVVLDSFSLKIRGRRVLSLHPTSGSSLGGLFGPWCLGPVTYSLLDVPSSEALLRD